MLIPCVHVEITWLMNSWILQLKDSNFTRLCSTKSMLTVNESFPGPTIRVRKGDTAIVNVHNYGRYGVTIHWSCLALSHITSYFFNLSHEVRFCWIQLDIWFFSTTIYEKILTIMSKITTWIPNYIVTVSSFNWSIICQGRCPDDKISHCQRWLRTPNFEKKKLGYCCSHIYLSLSLYFIFTDLEACSAIYRVHK